MWMILDRIGAAYSSQYTLTVTRAENGERRAWGASVTRHAAVRPRFRVRVASQRERASRSSVLRMCT